MRSRPVQNRSFRVYIGGLPRRAKMEDVKAFFHKYRRRFDVLLKTGFGFLEFDDYRDADDAVFELNGQKLLGEKVTVEHARGPRRDRRDGGGGGRDGGRDGRGRANWVEKYGPPTRTNYRIIVENLSSRVSWQDLKDLMRRAGEVCYANAHNDRRNEGVVEFSSRRDMERAMDKFEGYDLHGRKLHIVKEKEDSRSRSRSRSRSHSRSRTPRSKSRSHSRSRSGSRDRDARDKKSVSRDRSRDRSRSADAQDKNDKKSEARSRSRSRSKSRERSRSRSVEKSKRRLSGSRSRSRSMDKEDREKKSVSRSRSRSPANDDQKRRSHSRSRSAERRSRSRSPRDQSPGDDRKRSASPDARMEDVDAKKARIAEDGQDIGAKTDAQDEDLPTKNGDQSQE